MNKYIMYFVALLAALYCVPVCAQTNLICNPSFENVNEETFNGLNDGTDFHATHLVRFGDEHSDKSLFNCWNRGTDHSLMGPGLDMGGLVYGIAPGLFPVWQGETFNLLPYNENFVNVTDTNQRAFVDNNNVSGLTLSENSEGLYGFDLSPPNTRFGENVHAPHGNNYAGLFDFENDNWRGIPALVTELKYPIAKDVEYTFSMNFCKMNLLGYIKDSEDWGTVQEGDLKVWVCDHELNHKQLICEVSIDDNAWDITTWNFTADRSSTHLLIEYDPIKGGLVVIGTKIAGAFIDNLKLYEACETAENMCDNANYRRDLLDVELEEAELSSPYAYQHPDLDGPPRMKTIRAYHLENVRRFEMKIYKGGSSAPIRTIDLMYPESDYFWDGRNYAGEMMPDDNDYRAIINAVSNDCFHITNADEMNFELRHNYSPFNVWTSTNIEDDNTFINGLENVHFMNVKINTVSGQLVHEFNLNNPPASIGLSIPSLETYGGAQNGQVAPGSYQVVVTVSNNCAERTYGSVSASVHGLPDNGGNSPFYNWSSVTKPTEFSCPFSIDYNHNYLTPMDCCEGNLYLHDVEVWNDWDVQIWDTIFIGPNVVFSDDVTNNLVAGEQIILVPDETGVIVNTETVLTTGDLNCVHCKNVTITGPDEEENTGRETVNLTDSVPVKRSQEMVLFPNPANGDQEMTVLAGSVDFDPVRYELVLSNSLGKPVAIKVTKITTDQVRFKPAQLSVGVYYLFVESNGIQQTFSLVIR